MKANESPPLLIAYQKVDQLKPYDHDANTLQSADQADWPKAFASLVSPGPCRSRQQHRRGLAGEGCKVLNVNEVPTIRLELLPQLLVGKVAVSIELHLRAQNLDCRRTPVSQ